MLSVCKTINSNFPTMSIPALWFNAFCFIFSELFHFIFSEFYQAIIHIEHVETWPHVNTTRTDLSLLRHHCTANYLGTIGDEDRREGQTCLSVLGQQFEDAIEEQ